MRLERQRQALRRALARWKAATAVLAVVAGTLLIVVVPSLAETEPREPIPLGTGVAGVEAADGPAEGSAAAPTPAPREVPRAVPPPAAGRRLGQGEASYYHDSLEGRPTASGEAYQGTELTAAHRSLPFGTRLRVTNVRNGRSVVVRVNDRGPFHPRRVLDLSREAARQLGILQSGRAKVELEILHPEPPQRLSLRTPLGALRFPF